MINKNLFPQVQVQVIIEDQARVIKMMCGYPTELILVHVWKFMCLKSREANWTILL